MLNSCLNLKKSNTTIAKPFEMDDHEFSHSSLAKVKAESSINKSITDRNLVGKKKRKKKATHVAWPS